MEVTLEKLKGEAFNTIQPLTTLGTTTTSKLNNVD